MLSEALSKTRLELGENLKTNYTVYTNGSYINAKEFRSTFLTNCNYIGKLGSRYSILNYNGTKKIEEILHPEDAPGSIYLLKNGSSVGITITASNIYVTVDTNGPQKGPNRFGYDFFEFKVNENDRLHPLKMTKLYSEEALEGVKYPNWAGTPCSVNSNQELNGIGCSWYAHHDINPDDDTKGYWESLNF